MSEIKSIPHELIRIFARQGKSMPKHHDDAIAVDLLFYLQKLAQEEKLHVPALDMYLAKKYPRIDMGVQIINILRDKLDNSELEKPNVASMTDAEYVDICKNVFPSIVLETYPKPENAVDPYKNLFAAWTLEVGERIKEEIWYGSKKIRNIFNLIREYIFLNVNDWPEGAAHWFFVMWNGYLLTHEWSDRIAELEALLADERDYSKAQNTLLAKLSTRLEAKEASEEGQYLTITDAVRKVLEAEYGRTVQKTALNTMVVRIFRKIGDATFIQTRANGPKYYRYEDVVPLFICDSEVKMTEDRLRAQLIDVATPKSRIR